jgi:hypothetical protein
MTGPFTFTSPSVYLAYDTISIEHMCTFPRKAYNNGILTMQPSEVSSVVRNRDCPAPDCTTGEFFTTRPFDYADLQGDVPAGAYFDAQVDPTNSTIVESSYFPFLAIPTQVQNLDPEFSKCLPFSRRPGGMGPICHDAGFWDPPIVLIPTAVLQTPVIHSHSDNSVTPAPGHAAGPAFIPKTKASLAVIVRPTDQPNEANRMDFTLKNYATYTADPDTNKVIHSVAVAAVSRTAREATEINASPDRSAVFWINGKPISGKYFPDGKGGFALGIGGTTLLPGGPSITIEGKILNMETHGSILVNGSPVMGAYREASLTPSTSNTLLEGNDAQITKSRSAGSSATPDGSLVNPVEHATAQRTRKKSSASRDVSHDDLLVRVFLSLFGSIISVYLSLR